MANFFFLTLMLEIEVSKLQNVGKLFSQQLRLFDLDETFD